MDAQMLGTNGNDDEDGQNAAATSAEWKQEIENLSEFVNAHDTNNPYSIRAGIPNVTASAPRTFPTMEEKMEIDSRSIHVANVDYGATAEEVSQHFHGCGCVNRVTIPCNPDSTPKGYAYVEFGTKEGCEIAMEMTGSLLRGRALTITPKRTNKPFMSARGSHRPFRPSLRGIGAHGFSPYGRGRPFRGRGRGFRGRGFG